MPRFSAACVIARVVDGDGTADQSRRVLQACKDAGLGLRVHGNQLDHGPGVRLAVELGNDVNAANARGGRSCKSNLLRNNRN